jgi:hypothetical protein
MLMNEEISVTLVNNTSLVQPVSLFTEVFGIPQNLVSGSNTFSWNLSSESYFWGFTSATASIQYATTPTNNLTPYTTTGVLPSLDITGLVTALNGLGIGTFTATGNTLSIQSSAYFFGNLILSPDFNISVTSNTVSGYPALTVSVNGNNVLTIPSATNVSTDLLLVAQGGDNIAVGYSAGAGATSWNIGIAQNQPPPTPPIPIFSNSGVGATLSSYSFPFPANGQILITFITTP